MHCTCEHKKSSHHYVLLVGDNSGYCLSLNCSCKVYEEAEDD